MLRHLPVFRSLRQLCKSLLCPIKRQAEGVHLQHPGILIQFFGLWWWLLGFWFAADPEAQ